MLPSSTQPASPKWPRGNAGEIATGGRDYAVGEATNESFQEMKARKIAAIEINYIRALLRRHDGNVTHCAVQAGMSRSAFQKLMQRYDIKSSGFRAEG